MAGLASGNVIAATLLGRQFTQPDGDNDILAAFGLDETHKYDLSQASMETILRLYTGMLAEDDYERVFRELVIPNWDRIYNAKGKRLGDPGYFSTDAS